MEATYILKYSTDLTFWTIQFGTHYTIHLCIINLKICWHVRVLTHCAFHAMLCLIHDNTLLLVPVNKYNITMTKVIIFQHVLRCFIPLTLQQFAFVTIFSLSLKEAWCTPFCPEDFFLIVDMYRYNVLPQMLNLTESPTKSFIRFFFCFVKKIHFKIALLLS